MLVLEVVIIQLHHLEDAGEEPRTVELESYNEPLGIAPYAVTPVPRGVVADGRDEGGYPLFDLGTSVLTVRGSVNRREALTAADRLVVGRAY